MKSIASYALYATTTRLIPACRLSFVLRHQRGLRWCHRLIVKAYVDTEARRLWLDGEKAQAHIGLVISLG